MDRTVYNILVKAISVNGNPGDTRSGSPVLRRSLLSLFANGVVSNKENAENGDGKEFFVDKLSEAA